MRKFRNVRGVSTPLSALCLLTVLCGASFGCAADDPFHAESDDEYTDELRNAVIGTPDKLITVPLAGPAIVSEAPNSASGGRASGSAGAGGGTSSGGAAGAGLPGAGAPGSGAAPSGGAPSGGAPSGGSPGAGGEGPGGEGPGGEAGGSFGSWHFDDCSPTSHFLIDSSGLGANAQQPLKAACVPGMSGLGVQFRSAKDVVQIADQPQFTVDQHLAVAAWVNPKTVSGDQPIIIKRLNNKTAFSLGIHKGNLEMSVVLSTGQTIISRAPIAANKWTHVAGMFDGTFVFLFIDGQQFGQVYGAGTVRNVLAPIRIGATTQSQFFNGTIDEVFLTTEAISASTLTSLSCITRPSTLTVTPPSSGPVPFDTSVRYDVSVLNNDAGSCAAKSYNLFFNTEDPGISTVPLSNTFQFVPGGAEAKFSFEVSGSDLAEPGLHALPFTVNGFISGPRSDFELLNGQLNFELAPPAGCFVSSRRELMITNTSVVDDPIRTAGSIIPFGGGSGGGGGIAGAGGAFGTAGSPGGPQGDVVLDDPAANGGGSTGVGGSSSSGGVAGGSPAGGSAGSGGGIPGTTSPAGVWSFGYLMRQMAPTPEAAPAMTLKLLQHWLTDQTVNGFTVAARPAMQQQLIDIWPKTANGELDLDQSPLTLQSIVNRIDVRNLAEHSAGEGRFVFGVNGPGNFQNFTVIVEYNLVAQNEQDVTDWANRWHELGSLPFPSEQYNAALEAVTRRFTDRDASPGSVNGSALVELRTNEIALSSQWELRSFALSSSSGMLEEVTLKETPDLKFNGTATFASFVNQNASSIIAEVPGGDLHTVPLQFGGAPFMAGSVFNNLEQWNGPGIADPEARFHASLNTCNGCHSAETGTLKFLMVIPRSPGTEAQLSPFITGTTVFDPFSRQTRTLNDLKRRKDDLTSLVCSSAVQAVALK